MEPNTPKIITIREITAKAESGDISAQVALGIIYERGLMGADQDCRIAVRWFSAAAKLGDAFAQRSLAQLLSTGRGAIADYSTAFDLFVRAAEQGDASAMVDLGEMYFQGIGTPRNYRAAFKCFGRARRAGYSIAYIKLINMYYCGYGVSKNYKLAGACLLKLIIAKPTILIRFPLTLIRKMTTRTRS
jgi:TPR repeat protein